MTHRIERIGNAELHLADCREVLGIVGGFDCSITDPPYNCGKAYGTHNDEMSPDDYCQWLGDRFHALPTDHLIYTPGDRHLWDVPKIMAAAGFRVNRPLGWHKKEFAGDKWTSGPAMCWEPIIWATSLTTEKRFNKIFGTSGRDFLVVNATHGDPYAKEHPCPKPLAVVSWLVGLFCPEAGSVIDPFMGTGAVGHACALLGRRFTGIEIHEPFFDTACRRIEQAYRQADLFVTPPVASPTSPLPDLFANAPQPEKTPRSKAAESPEAEVR